MKRFAVVTVSIFVFCAAFWVDGVDFSSSQMVIVSQAQAYYGTGRRVARRTARRTTRRVAYRRSYYRPAPVVRYGAPVAAAAAGLAIGATVASLPSSSCQRVVINGTTCYNCDGTYYQQAYDGPDVVYIVIPPPE